MKRIFGILFILLALVLCSPTQSEAQIAQVRINFGAPTVHVFGYRPGVLTIRPAPDVVVLRKRAVKNGHVIVYKDRPDYIIRTHHNDFVRVGFSRVSVKKRKNTTTVIYRRGDERVKLVVKPYRKNWEAHIVSI